MKYRLRIAHTLSPCLGVMAPLSPIRDIGTLLPNTLLEPWPSVTPDK